jgi:hypothetical protein
MTRFAKACVFGFLSIVWAFSSNTVLGQDVYRVETSANYFELEEDSDLEITLYGLTASIYFNPVDVGKHPLAEAAFLERIGSVSLAAAIMEYDFGFGVEADGSVFGVGVTYAQPNQPFYARGAFVTRDSDFDPPLEGEISEDEFEVALGVFLKDGLLVGFEYGHFKGDLSIDGIWSEELEKDKFGIGTKWVHELENGTAVNLEASVAIEDTDDRDDGSNTIVGVAGDFYVNPRTSIGAGFALNTGDYDADEGETFQVRFRTFLDPRFSVGASFTKFLADDDNDSQSIGVSLSLRF